MGNFDVQRTLRRLVSAIRRPGSKRSIPRLAPADSSHLVTPLPHLPPELWIIILRHATSSSALPDSSSSTVSFLTLAHSHTHFPHRLFNYRTSMRRKARMTLVCKDWYVIAQQVLFEFVWISRASEARTLATLLLASSNGKYIRRLHIETPSLERCDPADLRTILDCAPRLVVYSDYRSVRRSFRDDVCDPRASPKQLFSALAHPNNSLRRLSWTNYDDVSFHLHMSPMLETTAANLEYLELNFCSTHLHSMFSSSPASLPDDATINLTLPALRSLKVTLDNATFAVLASWSMPSLENLSVLSADFSYASSGFSQFFIVHGPKLIQLELGHSSSTIEEHYLTAPPPPPLPPYAHGTHPQAHLTQHAPSSPIPLAHWCPNLVQFICSADAEWNWQHPDWIAPHVLLPTHPTLQFIGIRDIDKRLRDDLQQGGGEEFFMLGEQIGSLLRREHFPALLYIRDLSWESDLMRRGIAQFHHGGRSTITLPASAVPSSSSSIIRRIRRHTKMPADVKVGITPETRKVIRFWRSVLERCRDGGVWMEDFTGVNVTMRDLRRAEAGMGVAVGVGLGLGLEIGEEGGGGW